MGDGSLLMTLGILKGGFSSPMSLKEFVTDPSSGVYSCSRLGLLSMNILAWVATIWLLHQGKDISAAVVVTGVAATDAGVYFASTRKGGKGQWES